MKLNSFFKECSQKEVFKRASIYIVSSWVLLQVLAVTWEPLALPKKSVTVGIIILLIGFPIYLLSIWYFQLRPLEKEDPKFNKKGKIVSSKFQKAYHTAVGIITLLVVISVFFIGSRAFSAKKQQATLATFESTDKIGVMPFGNNTGDASLDIVSKMTADWLSHGIIQNKVGQVISPEVVNQYVEVLIKENNTETNEAVLQKYFKPKRIIKGNFFLDKSTLLFQSSITDSDINKILIAFKPISCDKENPLDCIEELKERILGYLATDENKSLNLQEARPTFQAYKNLLEAKSGYEDQAYYINMLNKAIAADTNYFEPKVLQIGYYYNQGDYKKADSLLKKIQVTSMDNKRQKNLLHHYQALLEGNNRKIYSTVLEEYYHAPFDLQSNSNTMVVAQQFVNKPEDVSLFYEKVNMEALDIENCTFCQFRYYIKALADVALQKYDLVIDYLTPIAATVNQGYLKRPI